ncbi:MAG: hypothetical protein DRN15_07250 [Thermoprotei archaeon]|nr:MAG: hypothetical protein DRN15_07250 [Thermoprotei archaeon]
MNHRKRRHLWVSEDAYWILQELKARLRCKTYDELFQKLQALILEQAISLNQVVSQEHIHEPIEELPSYLRNNPWLGILARRGRDVQA